MKRRLIIRPEAESDIIDAVDWYERLEAGLGVQVTAELHAAIKRTIEYPRSHQLIRRLPEVRRLLAHRFPYRVFYIVRDDAIIIFAVLHEALHDRKWQRRI